MWGWLGVDARGWLADGSTASSTVPSSPQASVLLPTKTAAQSLYRSCMCVFSAAEAMHGLMLAVFNEQKCKRRGHADAAQKATHQSHFQPAWM